MSTGADLGDGARKLVQTCAKVQGGERVLVLTDTGRSLRIAHAVYEACLESGAQTVMMIMEPGIQPGAEVPQAVAEAMLVSHVIFGLTSSSLYHTRARLAACGAGARLLAVTEVTEDLMISGGIRADFEAQLPAVEALAARISSADEIRLLTKGGTDLRARTGGRRAIKFTGLAHGPGEAVGVPDIEVALAPLEGTSEGVLVVDASGTHIGLIREPIRITVQGGQAVRITGGQEAENLMKLLDKNQDPNCLNVAEIAIGLNPCCRLTGSIIEDEGKLGTCHVALGNNLTLGGLSSAKVHIDLVMLSPTLYLDGKEAFCAHPLV